MNVQQRIIKEIKLNYNYIQMDYNNGIILKYNINGDIFNSSFIIFGLKNTPYQYGFLLFDCYFHNNYPYQPPKCKFNSVNQYIRIHPNLYQNGKICLSILDTYLASKWSPCHTLISIAQSIRNSLNENPLSNEPGQNDFNEPNEINKKQKYKYQEYNELVQYSMIKLYIIEQYLNSSHNIFYEIMTQYIQNNLIEITNFIIDKIILDKTNAGIMILNNYYNYSNRSVKYNIEYNNIKINYQNLLYEWLTFILVKTNLGTNYIQELYIIYKKYKNIKIIISNIFDKFDIFIMNSNIKEEQLAKNDYVAIDINENENYNIENCIKPIVDTIIKPDIIIDINENIEHNEEPIIENIKEPMIETIKEPIIETIKEPIIETNEPIIETKEPIIETNEPMIDNLETNSNHSSQTTNKKGKRKNTQPNEQAKNYDDNYIMLSTNDNRYYKVVSYERYVFVSGIKKTYQVKRWILNK